MKKIFILVIICSLILMWGCKQEQKIEVNKLEEAEEEKLIAVAIEFPPFEYKVDGEFTGPGIEVVRKVFERLGYDETEYEIKEFPLIRILDAIKSGEIDVVIDMYKTEEREEFIDFTEEHYVIQPVVVLSRVEDKFEFNGDLEGLGDKTVGVIRDFTYGPIYKEAVEKNILKLDYAKDAFDNIEKLKNGRVDLVLESKYTAIDILKSKGYRDEIKVSEESIYEGKSYIGVSKNSKFKDLAKKIDEELKKIREEKIEEEIYSKYFD